MAIDRDAALMLDIEPVRVTVERGALRFFAQSIGESRPEYVDVGAARSAGYRDLPVPPTYYFSLELQGPDPFGYLTALDVDLRGVLHGEQSFDYVETACANDHLVLRSAIVDVVSKKGGAMELVTKRTSVDDERGKPVASLTSLIVVRSLA